MRDCEVTTPVRDCKGAGEGFGVHGSGFCSASTAPTSKGNSSIPNPLSVPKTRSRSKKAIRVK
ncbi:hypothetical protein JHK87_000237 [Glycine soja]|nr:hypothetical protein JHK87_000237 [Glycine soja]